MASTIKLKRGLESARTGITPADGEVIYTTDGKELFFGDGSTAGGLALQIAEANISDLQTYLTDVVADTTPQLGGNLDLNSNDITGTGNISITGTATMDGLTVDTNTLYVDATNNRVGIGTSTPTNGLTTLAGSSNTPVATFSGIATARGLVISTNTGGGLNEAGVDFNAQTATYGQLRFSIAGTEAMRIDSSGNLMVGTTTTGLRNTGAMSFTGGISTYSGVLNLSHSTSNVSGAGFINFSRDAAYIGSIAQSGTTGVSYNTSSDYRLKENVAEMADVSSRVLALKPCRFNFIADPDITVDGFLAHEAQTVVPEAVHGTKDEVDDEGNPVYQGIDQSKLVPLLTAALQEAIAKIETLETRLNNAGL